MYMSKQVLPISPPVMSKVLLIFVALRMLCSESIDAELCKKTPPEKHCLIEYAVAKRWPHTVRYVYDWYTRNCFEIRWAAHCPAVGHPATTNNFPTRQSCVYECGGWA